MIPRREAWFDVVMVTSIAVRDDDYRDKQMT